MLWYDCETFSETPIRDGTYRYANNCEVMIVTWALDDAPVQCWDATHGGQMPAELEYLLRHTDEPISAHAAMFDRNVLRLSKNVRIEVPVERWRCTMAKALAHSLPGSLDKLCEVLDVPQDQRKLKIGKDLVRLFCMPRPKNSKIRRATRETHPVEWAQFLEYAKADIDAMRAVDAKLPNWNYSGQELALWHLDQRINDRGFAVDLALAEGAIAATVRETQRLSRETHELTGGEVGSTTQRDALLDHLAAEYGILLPDLQGSTIERRLNDPDLPEGFKALLINRQQASTTSTSKYKALIKGHVNGRLQGTLQFCGAGRTGRWSGRTFQPQNLYRPAKYVKKEWEFAATAIRCGGVELVYDNPMEVIGSMARGCIIAPPGRKLVAADLSNIEGRDGAWLGGEEWKLQAFRDFDAGTGPDLYKLAYAKAFGISPDDVDDFMRQIGKVMELACLGPETLVLTKERGYTAILDVTTGDEVWDGVEWVRHQGLLARGVKPVVNVAGIRLTSDHLLLCGEEWMPAQQLATCENTLSRALATGSANLPSWALKERGEGLATTTWFGSSARAGQHRTWCSTTTCVRGLLHAASRVLRNRAATIGKIFGGMPISLRRTITADVCSTEFPLASIGATTPTIAGTTATAREVFTFLNCGDKIGAHFSDILSRWKTGTKRITNSIASMLIKGTNPATFGSSLIERIKAIAARFARCKKLSNDCSERMPTYDLACCGPRNRFTILSNRGPLIAHNCQYQGRHGAFITFALVYGIDLEKMAADAYDSIPADTLYESGGYYDWTLKQKRSDYGLSRTAFVVIDAFVVLWRAAHPNIHSLWKQLEYTCIEAVESPGKTLQCRKFKVRRDGAWLRIGLPSGRALCYPSPRVDEGKLSYTGIDQYTRQWTRLKTYGGKLFENCCQAVARDVMATNMQRIEGAGYEIVLTVHDEVITEAPDSITYTAEQLSTLLATNPVWAPDMPLAAAGFEAYRYRKE